MPDDEDIRNEDSEDEDLQEGEDYTEGESEETEAPQVGIETEHFEVEGENIAIGGNINNITFRGATDRQIRNVLKDLNEGNLARHIP
jgi:hypothetical protein